MSTSTVVVDNIYGVNHARNTSTSLLELVPEDNLHYLANFSFADNNDRYLDLTRNLAGSVDVINWSFGQGVFSSTDYIFDNAVRDAFLEGTAVTTAAGNFSSDRMKDTQRSPYDFTVGSIETFEWNAEGLTVGDRATKTAKWEFAWFNDNNPTFVDFYTYGDGGTSFAAPRVAAYIAQIRDQDRDASLSSIRTILEKNSDYKLIQNDTDSWYVQVLDPYNLENNTARDGEYGYIYKLFSEQVPESEYEFDFDFSNAIDTRVRTEALYEVYLNRNPDEEGLAYWMNQVDEFGASYSDLANFFEYVADNDLDIKPSGKYDHNVPLIEKVQGLYHLHLGRETKDSEVVEAIDYMHNANLSWNEYVDQWMANANVII